MLSFSSGPLATVLVSLASANPFILSAYLPGHTINGQVVNAGAEALFLGLSGPSSYCPSPPVPANDCPAGTKTLFVGGLSMAVEVPGGEMSYVAPDGEIKYTGPHSAYMPPGSFVGGFSSKNISVRSDHHQENLMNWKAPGVKRGGIYACPHVPSYINATYKIFAKTQAFIQEDCIKLKGLLQHEELTNEFGAWEYT